MPLYSRKHIPPAAEEFIRDASLTRAPRGCHFYRAALHHFHRFLAQSKLEMRHVTFDHMREFHEDLERHSLRLESIRTVFYIVRYYLRYLEERELVPAGTIQKLYPNYRPEFNCKQAATLPELAQQFLKVMAATHKPHTVNGYRVCLRAFYRLHWKREKVPYRIIRDDIEAFMIDMQDRKLDANQRIGRLVQLRRYLDWLYDHKRLKTHPDELLKRHDFPKQVERLPRPFPVGVDLEIQKRLAHSDDIDFLGLLVMRRTGLRVGELCNLTIDCVKEDLNGNFFLHVPLGKLNNERVVPLDPATVDIVDKIKRVQKEHLSPKANTAHLICGRSGKRRTRRHMGIVFQEVTRGLAIPGRLSLHRLRHSFATSLLSAGLSITSLKRLLGHKDIRMTLNYAAVTQETIRNEYFTALSKVQSRYEVASYPLKTPDLREGINRSFYEARRLVKKYAKEHGVSDERKLVRLMFRLNILRHELSTFLKNQ